MLSVYNGKGRTDIAAKVGAIMEAVERHAGLTFERTFLRASFADISTRRRTLDPEQAGAVMHPDYAKDREILWTEGHDLFGGEPILVPADLAGYNAPRCSSPETRAFAFCTTNGLASGNTYEEAVAQGLCEVIERDAWTIAAVLSHWLPRAKFEAERAKAGLPKHVWDPKEEQPFEDDGDRYPIMDPDTFDGEVREVYDRFLHAGLSPSMRDITSDIGIPTFVVSCTEDVSADLPRAHLGVGTHQEPSIAALRALTETAQSRVVDIQGVREDMVSAEEKVSRYMSHAKRVSRISRRIWYHMDTTNRRSFADVPCTTTGDTLDDIKVMLDGLRRCDLNLAIEVDVTNPEVNLPVTRVIVPGLESWAADHGRVGRRGAKHWNAHRS
jgi:ribosomal protein S12 methylthiotransferase accessory factor